ncbi:MAG: ATP-binding cassette domain-containing protein [Chloroflexi bacterium]|nr:ATP-binding cassette domain-containing protein [Chloroflexota bacterium]
MQNETISEAILVEHVSKVFKNKTVLDDISMIVPAGQIYGLSGPNGAGKSILLRILCGLMKPTSGSVTVLGKRLGTDCDFPPSTGALIDTPGFLPQYSGYRNLEMLASIQNKIPRADIEATMRLLGLDPLDDLPMRSFSNGMRQRLGIAQAVMEKPQVLILDEPTDAIDQAGWRDVYQHLIELREGGTAILLASNNLDEIKILCDEAFILEKGRIKRA